MITIANANALHLPLPDQSVQCVVTSPPYWGLRDYGTAKWEGGNAECDHSPADTPNRRGIASSTLDGGKETTGHQQEGYAVSCARCGARRIDAQIGLEQQPDCGMRGKMKLKKGLTADQIKYVLQRLVDAGLLYAPSDDNGHKE